MSGGSVVDPDKPPGYGYQVPYAAGVRKLSGVKTMAVGHIIHADQAEQILRDGSADLVAIGRELFLLARKARLGRLRRQAVDLAGRHQGLIASEWEQASRLFPGSAERHFAPHRAR